ncbi:methionyl-tRNA formyltransferase [Paludicola sp. MB14-C6]|uniref:methionyl-tRNA formyltransferase n=1 Tax=Paludihabitans sp. MB14-C6 TaxID=3070656 RepID=UPI0027DCAC9B|nr:methionyl-tRNA formyltransferase [Paludicola sp. MB14-C6]WMJ22378.1 methionyl-tRNA formyltransferase [Paludicola sp. MB14-C6]
MKIVFMGTPDFAVPTLKALIEHHEVVAVFTQTDKKKGRGHKVCPPPIKELALEHDIPVYQPITLKTEEPQAILREINPDLIVVVAYGKLLPKAVLELPRYGCINVHASLLPKYRGAGPIQWSVLNGETVTGVTTMYMAEGIDTGDMLLKAETEIGENETASELHDRLSELGAPLLLETLEQLQDGTLKPIAQNDEDATKAPMLSKEMSQIDFSKDAQLVHNLIRGLSEWPCAQTAVNGKRLKVYRSKVVDVSENAQAGILLSDKELMIACGNNTTIELVEVQYEGSKRMGGADFLRGQRLEKGTQFGE